MSRWLALGAILSAVAFASAATIMADGFEYATQAEFEAAWPNIAAPSATLDGTYYHSGAQSARTLVSASYTGRNYQNLDAEYNGTDAQPLVVEYWMYYVPGGTRHYNEVRAYADGGYGVGDLEQLYAAGWTNNATAPDVWDSTKFQARVAFGDNWVNLNEPGCPDRSEGWHKFTIEFKSATVAFYVDDILGRSLARPGTGSLDSLVLGSGLTSGGIESYTDDFSVSIVPEPTTLALLAFGGLALLRRR